MSWASWSLPQKWISPHPIILPQARMSRMQLLMHNAHVGYEGQGNDIVDPIMLECARLYIPFSTRLQILVLVWQGRRAFGRGGSPGRSGGLVHTDVVSRG